MRRLHLGWAGALGAALIAGGCAFLVLVLAPLEHRHATLLDEARSVFKQRSREESGLIAVSAPQSKLAAFYTFFERNNALTDHLARLESIARQTGVDSRVGDYRLAEPRGVRLAEYSVSMPVAGSYGQVRAFLENSLEQIPVLVLDQVTIRRKRVTDHQVEADIRFTLFVSQP